MNRGTGLARTGGPKRSSKMLPCGKPYDSEEAARASLRGQREGAEVKQCLNNACKKFHVLSGPVSPDAPVKPQRARRNTDPPRAVRLAVAERSGGICERCRKARAVHVHHRQPKQAGGARRALIHALFNLAHLCPPCHRAVHAAPAKSYAAGWLVPTGEDPALWPLITRREDGTLVPEWLTADGKRTADEPEGLAA